MEDLELKQLFDSYKPELGNEKEFVDRISHNLDAIETISETMNRKFHTTRRARAIATFAGFLAGTATTLVMPFVTRIVRNGLEHVSKNNIMEYVSGVSYLLIAFVTISAAYYSYRFFSQKNEI